MFKMTGFGKLQKTLQEAQNALSALDGELGTVQFNPRDPASIELAVQSAETIIDERLGPYMNNAVIGPLAEQMKEKYRNAIVDRAAKARLDCDADGK